jgi:aldehyde dehydrogenase (NAD+)/succinate-semialdehyde dehydrogenase/glutarate-semialdehyde dehydrogenase
MTVADAPLIRVLSPLTGEPLGTLPQMQRDQIAAVVERARAAQPAWEALGVKARARLLRQWVDLVLRDRATLIEIIRQETGKTESSALVEILALDNIANYYAKHAPRILRSQRRQPLIPLVQRAQVNYYASGVVAFITPWNYPYLNSLCDLLPALVAGNAVVVKPSELAPYAAIYGVEKLIEVGVPRDVVGVVTGDGKAGSTLVDYVDMISVTGSTTTGRSVALRAAERLIPYSLELGGKDPLIVLDDADLDAAVMGTLRAALENAGQACISVERVYVEAGIYDRFVARALELIQQMPVGAESGMATCVGCLTNERELLRTEAHIQNALERGARVLHGGKRRPDLGALFFEPTLLVDVNHTMQVMQEETFGPLVPIMKVRDAEEAVRLANDSQYGLSASIYSRDLKRAQSLASRLQCGDVAINRPLMIFGTPDLPMGGVKQSGIGRRNGAEGLLRFVRTQSILSDTLIGSQPALTFTDSTSLAAFNVMRRLRRWLPFV